MKILALHLGHDTSVALFSDFDRLFISKEERLNRVKGYNSQGVLPGLSLSALKSRFDLKDVDCLVLTRYFLPAAYYSHEPMRKKITRLARRIFRGEDVSYNLINQMRKYQLPEERLLDLDRIKAEIGVPPSTRVFFSNHHYAHALPTLFYKPEWEDALVYTADGGGDFDHYGLFHFNGRELSTHYGGDAHIFDRSHNEGRHSLGQMYCIITEIAGFKRNRHEGKITGLAAFGKPSVLEDLRRRYFVAENGVVRSNFASYGEMETFLKQLAARCPIEDLAASGQRILEESLVASVRSLQSRYPFRNIGLAGGVFSNVLLNQCIAEIPGIEDVFVFPPMSDEGLVIGAALDCLIREYGFEAFLKKRRELGVLYWGEDFGSLEEYLSDGFKVVARGDIVPTAARLLREGKVCALYTLGMEYGPRALGARSILISPADKSINTLVNKRLSRTEFMPFAPVVREERTHDVFEVPANSLCPIKYMTITCRVKPEVAGLIPAVVHVDGTARPQTVSRSDNPLYYDILEAFENLTGIPCLVNTSFNAHEEPIINTPEEALNALKHNRIDYLIGDGIIIGPATADGPPA